MRTKDMEFRENEFIGIVSGGDIAVEVGCGLLILMFAYTWIRYGLNMLFIIVPLALCAAYLGMYTLTPQLYRFEADNLTILHRFSRTQHIPYDSVFNMEYKKHDNMMNVTSENAVKLYCEKPGNKRKRTVVCNPRDVDGFVSAVKQHCPEFFDND